MSKAKGKKKKFGQKKEKGKKQGVVIELKLIFNNREKGLGNCGWCGNEKCIGMQERPICTGVYKVEKKITMPHSPCPFFIKKIHEMENRGYLYLEHDWSPEIYRCCEVT